MNCTTCEKFAVTDLDRKCIFVTGSSNFKLDSVLAHEQSEQHKKSTAIKDRKAPDESKAGEIIQTSPWRYKLSPPSKRTKPSGSSPVVKYTSQRSPHIFKKSISPIKTSTPIYIRRNLFTQNHEIFETKKADIQNLLFTNIDESQDNLEEDHKEEHVLDNEEVIEEDHVVDHEKDHMEDLEEEYKVF
ncbi:unnamed protein product [Mytilus edulis]|uniref:C17orf113 probable zinc finger domain-containing protein n=1 Tax=Mytilus edulis TaxID=6550 RepID=A0A8S3VH36_MYTED|nr:unnamed protein product [Mytilus edulis]